MIQDQILDLIDKVRGEGLEPKTIFINKQQERSLYTSPKEDLVTTKESNGCINTINGIKLVVVDEKDWQIQVSVSI